MLKLTNRVKNALGRSLGPRAVNDPAYIGSLQPETLLEMPGLGHRGIFDLSVALIACRELDPNEASCNVIHRRNIIYWPTWLANVGPELTFQPRYKSDAEAQEAGMVRITTRYNFSEWYNLIRTCANLHRGNIEWEIMQYGERAARGMAVCRTLKNMRDVEAYLGDDIEENDEQ